MWYTLKSQTEDRIAESLGRFSGCSVLLVFQFLWNVTQPGPGSSCPRVLWASSGQRISHKGSQFQSLWVIVVSPRRSWERWLSEAEKAWGSSPLMWLTPRESFSIESHMDLLPPFFPPTPSVHSHSHHAPQAAGTPALVTFLISSLSYWTWGRWLSSPPPPRMTKEVSQAGEGDVGPFPAPSDSWWHLQGSSGFIPVHTKKLQEWKLWGFFLNEFRVASAEHMDNHIWFFKGSLSNLIHVDCLKGDKKHTDILLLHFKAWLHIMVQGSVQNKTFPFSYMQEPISPQNLFSKIGERRVKFSIQSQSELESKDRKVPGNLFQTWQNSEVP